MEVKIYFEGTDDIKLSIEILEKLYGMAKDDWNDTIEYGEPEEIPECIATCDILQHLIETLKNRNKK